ncbi:MAG: DUF1614 domain-containing protein [Clostridia bacterium]|nr:MAG: DUF1614 domain-containing protein [Clostridia bacterium]
MLMVNIFTFSLAKLGLSPVGAIFLLWASLIGSVINIPLSRERVLVKQPQPFFFFNHPPVVQERVICINVGGAVIPLIFSLYLLFARAPLWPTSVGITVVALVTKILARPVPGVGISLPAFIPPLVAAAVAILIGGPHAPPVGYISGALGTLIGADLLNWRAIRSLGAQVVSIGGAGVFDGIFLVSIVAAFLSW